MALSTSEKKRAKYRIGKGKFAHTITKHDTNLVSDIPFSIYVGTGGNLTGTTEDGQVIELRNIANGTFIDFIKFSKIHSTRTSADHIVAIY